MAKILIVDDKQQNLFALKAVLNDVSATVFEADNGNDALLLTLEHDFAVAIVDIQMPEMNGYELVELWRGNPKTRRLPVIFVSAIHEDQYYHIKAYEAGAVDFLSKPFDPNILLSKVRIFLDMYEQREELSRLVKKLEEQAEEMAQIQAHISELNENLEEQVKERTSELKNAYEELTLLDKNKSEFIQVVAHELRTPLTLVQGYAQILEVSASEQ